MEEKLQALVDAWDEYKMALSNEPRAEEGMYAEEELIDECLMSLLDKEEEEEDDYDLEEMDRVHREYQLNEELDEKYLMTEDEMIAEEYKGE